MLILPDFLFFLKRRFLEFIGQENAPSISGKFYFDFHRFIKNTRCEEFNYFNKVLKIGANINRGFKRKN